MYLVRKKNMCAGIVAGVIAGSLLATAAVSAEKYSGEAGFKEYCTSCHAGGGNVINGTKTLSRKDREKNGIKTAKDIVTLMRNPRGGMTTFKVGMISDKEAYAIAEYVIKTFK